MSDLHRIRTLESLEAKGVYVNDYPGLIFEGKDISYFYLKFDRETLLASDRDGGKKESGPLMDLVKKLIAAFNEEYSLKGTDKELRIFYLDDQGYCIVGRVEDEREALRFPIGKREIVSERVFQVNLTRIYAAEGIDGVYQVRNTEVKGVYEGILKYIATYMYGWSGLFRQYETLQERTEVFRRFKPFKFPILGTKETLKNATFTIQLGIRSPNGDEDFKKVVIHYGKITLQDALST
ncbi:MAG: hypothetical protein KA771_09870 [Spirochaetales bacterium]|nr:hypothetical protein [Spirochaetales bacterium]